MYLSFIKSQKCLKSYRFSSDKLVLVKRMPRALSEISEYDALNNDFLTEYDLLNLDFNLDSDEGQKKSPKEIEVPAKDIELEEGQRPAEENFPPKEWWDLEEPAEVKTTTTSAGSGQKSLEARERVGGL